MKFQWHVVYTKPRWEKRVAHYLSRSEVENYCPLNRVVKQWSDRKKIVEEPLFSSYVFVRINAKQNNKVLETDGVLHFVHWLRKPAIIRNEEIDLIKQFLNQHINVKLERLTVNINDRIKIMNGPFMELEAHVVEIKCTTVRVSIPSLGYVMNAEKDNVKVI